MKKTLALSLTLLLSTGVFTSAFTNAFTNAFASTSVDTSVNTAVNTSVDTQQKQLKDSMLSSPTLRCLGTEPFWGIDVKGKALIFSDLGGEETLYNINFYSSSINHTNRWVMQAINKEAESPISLALHQTNQCTDGMSDFVYQHEVIITMPDHAVYSGCCNRLPTSKENNQ